MSETVAHVVTQRTGVRWLPAYGASELPVIAVNPVDRPDAWRLDSAGLPPDTRVLVSAGREADQPAFVAFRLGDGLVLRSGTPQWSRDLEERRLSVEVPRVTRRIWTLLSGRGELG